MNKVILQGRLTDDIKAEQTKKSTYANFTLAVRDRAVDEDGNPKAQFIRCVAFEKSAEILEEYTSKGSPLLISGRLNNYQYEDEEGNTRYGYNVVVEEFDLIGSSNKEDKKETKKSNKYHK